jgi:hypothetical protein
VPVYVSKLGGMGRLLAGRSTMPQPLFILTADSEEELHAFAARLGIRRDPGTPATPAGFVQKAEVRHYLLTEGERDQAVKLGAQPISARKAGKLERQQAARPGEAQA